MKIVAAAHLRILSTPFSTPIPNARLPPLYAGQPISAMLTITTSFHWGESKSQPSRWFVMRFDVEEMVKDWLVSGRKRGDFSVTVGHFPFRNILSLLICIWKGWIDLHRSNYSYSASSRRTCIAQDYRHTSSTDRRIYDGINGPSEHRYVPGSRGGEGSGAAQGGKKHIRHRHGWGCGSMIWIIFFFQIIVFGSFFLYLGSHELGYGLSFREAIPYACQKEGI